MNVGSLFTGIGGLDLAVGGDTVWMCEYDPHCQQVLEQRFPGIPCYPDVRELDAGIPRVDVLCGGYPCQPFSVAGKRGGDQDPRHLWPEMARVARLLRPPVLVLENVRGHLALGFDTVLNDLAGMGYDARWGVVRASDVGAPHQRARLFVVATDTDRDGARANGTGGARAALEAQRRRLLPGSELGYDVAADADEPTGARQPDPPERSPHGRAAAGRDSEDAVPDAVGGGRDGRPHSGGPTVWGAYGPAVHRWEHILGRPAPAPTDDRGRLMPEFVEWMMGFPPGWTDGVKRTQRLKMLGNAVVPQQAAYALGLLW